MRGGGGRMYIEVEKVGGMLLRVKERLEVSQSGVKSPMAGD